MEFRETESTEAFLSGGGEMGKLIRSMDWSSTALGPVEEWPQSLRTSVSLCLSSTFPILIAWGPETIQIYNDSYRPICGAKHPESMGQNFRICWETALPVVGDKFDRGQQGEGTYITDQRMFLDRYGYLEESWMTFSFAPIRDESGGVGGIFHPITESTEKMLSGRRTQALRDLGAAVGKAKSVEEIGATTQQLYADYQLDLPFILLYGLDGDKVKLIASAGIEPGTSLTPLDAGLNGPWPFDQTGEMLEVTGLDKLFGEFTCQPYDIPPHTAMLLPLRISGQENPYGYVVAGVSACRALDDAYRNFYGLLGATFNTAISNVYAYEQEQKRAEALAAIDRSKTAFFSNVSHEFRTPLTLMLGPLEDMLQKADSDLKIPLEATHRNALRLLKLVNNLLDFSRVEAGRAKAIYEQTDLQQFTTDLASSFRSIVEKAGMKLDVNCGPINGQVYVDQQMWEKVVLNLLSNAFKYTLEGKITVSQQQDGNAVVLKVTDTGVGIPENELPHMFERFHRVENSGGRTHEGSGIGLSLVHELVHLHGGDISVSSIEGKGSTFTVTIQTGHAHLPQDHIVTGKSHAAESNTKDAFLQEAESLLNDNENDISPELSTGERVLIVDDNADMRAYLVRLLEPSYIVETASNGKEALNLLTGELPALVISDVMMPLMDGKEMLKHIRADKHTSRLPVIFLSARAGEEARIDGLEAGADDYLIKPFSAAELLTKVTSQIKVNSARQQAEEQLRNLFKHAPVAIAIYRGPEFIVELANTQMLGYWGLDEEDVVGYPLLKKLPSLIEKGFDQIMQNVYLTGQRFNATQVPLEVQRDGKTRILYINLTLEPVVDINGVINRIIAVGADITEQVIAAKALERTNNTLNLAMEASGMGLWQTDWGTNILEVSERARRIHAIPLENELTFDGTLNVVVPEHRDRFLQAILDAVKNKEGFDEDYQIQPYDGGRRKWLNSTGRVHLDDAGNVKTVIGTILDITESKEDELRKNDFIGMVSHELKTPLTSLSGYTQLLSRHAEKNQDKFAQKNISKVQQQIKKMTSMINGFLNVSRLESGKIQLQKAPFNLAVLIHELIDEICATGNTHTINFAPAKMPTINADREKIGVVISNLLSNATKYAPGNSTIDIRLITENGQVVFSVADQGIGIKPLDLERLFDRFYRAEDKSTAHIAGFGIGLYLSDEIVKRHGGNIWAESTPGKGSTFYVGLPIEDTGTDNQII